MRYEFTVLLYPNLYSALAAAYSSAAAPSLLHALLLQCRQVVSQRGGVDSESACPPLFEECSQVFEASKEFQA